MTIREDADALENKAELPQTRIIPEPDELKAHDMFVRASDNNRKAHDDGKDLLGRERIIGLLNAGKAAGVNPKDRIGSTKVDFTLIPSSAKIQLALAQMDGERKYGAFNWRLEPVELMTYIGAAERHLECFKEGELLASDSGVQHLGHIMACCAIMIDAMQVESFVDNRPVKGVGSKLIDEANAFTKAKIGA